MVPTSIPAIRFLAWVPTLAFLHDGLELESQINAFRPQGALAQNALSEPQEGKLEYHAIGTNTSILPFKFLFPSFPSCQYAKQCMHYSVEESCKGQIFASFPQSRGKNLIFNILHS